MFCSACNQFGFALLLVQSIRVAEKITQKVEGQLSKSQKEFLLRQQVCLDIYEFLSLLSLHNCFGFYCL